MSSVVGKLVEAGVLYRIKGRALGGDGGGGGGGDGGSGGRGGVGQGTGGVSDEWTDDGGEEYWLVGVGYGLMGAA